MREPLCDDSRSSVTIVSVYVELAINLGPSIPAPQYTAIVSEGVVVGSRLFTVPVSHKTTNYFCFTNL